MQMDMLLSTALEFRNFTIKLIYQNSKETPKFKGQCLHIFVLLYKVWTNKEVFTLLHSEVNPKLWRQRVRHMNTFPRPR